MRRAKLTEDNRIPHNVEGARRARFLVPGGAGCSWFLIGSVTFDPSVNHKEWKVERILFLGSSRLGQIFLEALAGSSSNRSGFEVAALGTSSAFFSSALAKMPELGQPRFVGVDHSEDAPILRSIDECGITFVVSVQHPWVLSAKILDSVGGRAVNLHNAKLPEYRGHNAISHVLANKETVHHTTLHWMTEGVDQGKVIRTESIPVLPGDTALSLYLRSLGSVEKIAGSLCEYLAIGDVPLGSAQVGNGCYYPKRSIAALRHLDASGGQEELTRVSRAVFFPPFEPAYLLDGDQKIYFIPEGVSMSWLTKVRPENEPVWESDGGAGGKATKS